MVRWQSPGGQREDSGARSTGISATQSAFHLLLFHHKLASGMQIERTNFGLTTGPPPMMHTRSPADGRSAPDHVRAPR